jgi:hypothetical protein
MYQLKLNVDIFDLHGIDINFMYGLLAEVHIYFDQTLCSSFLNMIMVLWDSMYIIIIGTIGGLPASLFIRAAVSMVAEITNLLVHSSGG